jgi:MoxR-like ATPase
LTVCYEFLNRLDRARAGDPRIFGVEEFRDLRANLMAPVDLRGLPAVSGDVTRWLPPEFLPNEGEGILVIDELTSAPQMMQGAFYQLIFDRKLGDYLLPDGWAVIAAGNPASERGVYFSMPCPLRNRFQHLTLEPDLKDWCSWAVVNHIRPEIVAFLRFRPTLLLDPSTDKDANAWPTPRSWEMASKTLTGWTKGHNNVTDDLLLHQMNGVVGDAATGEFMGFLRLFSELPSTDEIMLNQKTAPVPEEPSSAIAVATALGRVMNDQNIIQIDK